MERPASSPTRALSLHSIRSILTARRQATRRLARSKTANIVNIAKRDENVSDNVFHHDPSDGLAECRPVHSPLVNKAAPMKEPAEPIVLASRLRRMLNFIIDHIVLTIIGSGIAFSVVVLFGDYLITQGPDFHPEDELYLTFVEMMIGIGTTIAYFAFMEGVFKTSVGKLLTSTRVVNEDGGAAHFGQILARTFCRFIPFEVPSFIGDLRPVGWRDRLSGTRVIFVHKNERLPKGRRSCYFTASPSPPLQNDDDLRMPSKRGGIFCVPRLVTRLRLKRRAVMAIRSVVA